MRSTLRQDQLKLDGVVDRAWRIFSDAEGGIASLVRPSIPIAWFGDLDAYLRSPLRVISVGLNPSRLEFPDHDRFERFPRARGLDGGAARASERAAYVSALNDYFRERPYTAWFRPSFEDLLQGMGSSFFGSEESTALHTDLFSPLATDPTWSKLGSEREILRASGVELWHDLVRLLAPDVILASVARKYLDEVAFETQGSWTVIATVERKSPYPVEARKLRVVAERQTTLVYGRAAQKPFGTISRPDKRNIGKTVLEHVRAG